MGVLCFRGTLDVQKWYERLGNEKNDIKTKNEEQIQQDIQNRMDHYIPFHPQMTTPGVEIISLFTDIVFQKMGKRTETGSICAVPCKKNLDCPQIVPLQSMSKFKPIDNSQSSFAKCIQGDDGNLKKSLIEQVIMAIKNYQEKYDIESFVVCGHSLGAVIASMVCFYLVLSKKSDLIHSVYLFGSPKMGNSIFASIMNHQSFPIYNIINQYDMIPMFPTKRNKEGKDDFVPLGIQKKIIIQRQQNEKKISSSSSSSSIETFLEKMHSIQEYRLESSFFFPK